jgi:glucosylceramidase
MTRVHEMFPAKNAYWTEGGPDYTSPAYGTDWPMWSAKFAGVLNNWSRSIVSWNLVLDEHGRPNIGPFSCGGLLTLDSRSGQLTRSGMYWALMHHARFIRPGARILSTEAAAMTGMSAVAAENPDGSRVLVLTNAGREREVACVAGGEVRTLHLPGDSVTTLLLKG